MARRLRELVLACASAPRELLQAWLPDAYAINADRPLKALALPTQFESERAERNTAVQSTFGLIKLFNTILNIDLKISVITRVVRNWLELNRLQEERAVRFLFGSIQTLGSIWLLGTLYPISSSLLL